MPNTIEGHIVPSSIGESNPMAAEPYGADNSVPNAIVLGAALAGNIGGGAYAYTKTGGNFWWTLLGIIGGGAVGGVVGNLLAVPLRK